MAARPGRSVFICQNCGYQAPKWLGRCPDCGAWSSMAEEMTPSAPVPEVNLPPRRQAPQPLIGLKAPPEVRQVSGLTEFDRTLGGSVVHGSVVLLGGDPGIGKSTLMLQVLDRLCRQGDKGLYISGEESETQIKLRSDRLGLTSPGLLVATETCLENILKVVEECRPAYLALDSIQTLYTATLPAAPGSLTQVRETAFRLVQQAKLTGIATFLIGHVTKEGAIAGPMVLEHLVDTVLYLEGDRSHAFRLLRTVKNRFGPTHELGIFEMQEAGLVEVTNPSGLFMAERSLEVPGAAVIPSLEGSRPILVEVQALVSPVLPGATPPPEHGRGPGPGVAAGGYPGKTGGAGHGRPGPLRQRGRRGAPDRTRRRPGGGPGPGLLLPGPAGPRRHPDLRRSGPHRRSPGRQRPGNAPQRRPQTGLQTRPPGPTPTRTPGRLPRPGTRRRRNPGRGDPEHFSVRCL